MLAECYIRDGHVVGIVGRRGDKLAEVAEGHPEVYCLKADVTDVGQIAMLLAALASEMGGLDLLVLCSGVGRMNPDLDYGLELPTVDTNVRGWTAVADWAFSFFMRQGIWALGRHFVGSRHPWFGSGSCLFRFQGISDSLFGSVTATCTYFPQEGLRDGCSSRVCPYSFAFSSRNVVLGG